MPNPRLRDDLTNADVISLSICLGIGYNSIAVDVIDGTFTFTDVGTNIIPARFLEVS